MKTKDVSQKEKVKLLIEEVAKQDRETQERARNQLHVETAKRLHQRAYDSRRRYDWEWLTRDLFRRGYQFSRYNATHKTMVLSTRSQVKIPINLVWSQMRTIRNQVTSFRPKWEVLPRGKDESSQTNAKYSGRLLDYYYDKFRLRKLIKETVIQGLMYSVGGPWQIGFDPNADEGKGEVYIWLLDTYDFFVDPMATSVDDAEYCEKCVRRPLESIQSDPNYKFHEHLDHGETRVASSEYKQFLLQTLKLQTSSVSDKKGDGAIVNEMWMKVRVTDKNKEELREELSANGEDSDDLRDGEVLMRVITYLDYLSDPLRVQLLRRSDFPFVIYQADINPNELYGEGWIKHVIPVNRVLNALESSVFEYNYKYAKGRLAVPKNSGVRIVSNQHGDIIEYNPTSGPPTSVPLNPLQPSYQMQIENMRRYTEDLGGAHEVSRGVIPAGVKSGVGIAELKASDATNQQDLVDNLEDFLVEVAKKLLREVARNYDVPRLIRALGKGGDPKHFAVVGDKAAESRKNKTEAKIDGEVFDLAVIGQDNEIRVNVGSWLAYTKDAQLEKLKEFYTSGIIDQKTFLENAEFPDVDAIVERTRKEEMLKKFRGQPAQDGMPTDEEIAQQENYQIVKEGKLVEAMPEDNHQVHLVVHQEGLGPNGNPMLEAHMAQHEQFIEDGVSQTATKLAGNIAPTEPVNPMESAAPTETAGMPTPSSPEEQALMQSIQGVM